MNSIQDIWAAVMEKLSENLTHTAIQTWFSDCTPIEIEGSNLVIHTTGDFKRNMIVTRFADLIKQVMSDIFSADFGLIVLAGDELNDYREHKKDDDPLPEMAGYTFENFIVGGSNKFAHNAAYAVSENPGHSWNPLFIYGNSGLGKTHLLYAIGQAIRAREPSTKIAYVKGDDFMNQFLKCLRESRMEEFRTKYRSVDLFLVDDIQFISGKEAIQNEFFHTFNAIFESGHQIVITSDRPPIEMNTLDDRLISRFQSGLLADIQPPDLETRMVITRTKAARLGVMLDESAVDYIAQHVTTNVRQIEGVINRLTAYKDILDSVIDAEAVERAIKDIVRMGTFIPSPQLIILESARYFGLNPQDIRGQNRTKMTVTARQIAMYLLRTLTNLSLKEIGAEFEGRNHATVLASINKIEELLKTDKSMRDTVRDITSNINSV